MSTNQELFNLNNNNTITWIKVSDLKIGKSYKIVKVRRVVSKFRADRMQTVVQLEDGSSVSLPSRYDDLSSNTYDYLNKGVVYMMNGGPLGKSWKIVFSEESKP